MILLHADMVMENAAIAYNIAWPRVSTVGAALLIGVPIICTFLYYTRLGRLRTAIAFGAGLGVAWAAVLWIGEWPLGWWEMCSPYMPTEHAIILMTQLAFYLLAMAVGVVLMHWALCRWVRGRVLIQDGLTCPNCQYCLRGNTTGICPECGHAYTLEELGIAAEPSAGAQDVAE